MDSTEVHGDGRPFNKPGLYRHPESGAEVIVTHNPKLGSAMADGVVQVGFKYVGPAPAEEVAPLADPEVEKSTKPKK